MWSLRKAQAAIVIAGCLGTAYTQLTTSVASIEFCRALGGGGLEIGVLSAIPTGMLFMQFVAAWIANSLEYRRPLWFWMTLLQRLLLLPLAAGPWLFPSVSETVWLWAFLAAFAAEQGLTHFTTPLWLSWMGDYLPREGLSSYWGIRHRWMQFTAAFVLLCCALWMWGSGMDVRIGFPLMVLAGTVLGIIDICLFFKVDEPRVTRLPHAGLWEVLSGPFRHAGFRSFIGFSCFWHFASMTGAPFISLYLLKYVGMSLFQVLLLWTCSWVGGAISSRWLGHAAEHYGNKPVLVICVALKSMLMASLLVAPQNPTLALCLLAPVFMFDMALNTGYVIAQNGFLLKHSPAANRTMYIASGTAVAGLVGGITSIVCGAWLTWMGDWSMPFVIRPINGFHVLFAVSIALRFVAMLVVTRIQEPQARSTMQVVTTLIGVHPWQMLRFPTGLYRRYFPAPVESRATVAEPTCVAGEPIEPRREMARSA